MNLVVTNLMFTCNKFFTISIFSLWSCDPIVLEVFFLRWESPRKLLKDSPESVRNRVKIERWLCLPLLSLSLGIHGSWFLKIWAFKSQIICAISGTGKTWLILRFFMYIFGRKHPVFWIVWPGLFFWKRSHSDGVFLSLGLMSALRGRSFSPRPCRGPSRWALEWNSRIFSGKYFSRGVKWNLRKWRYGFSVLRPRRLYFQFSCFW